MLNTEALKEYAANCGIDAIGWFKAGEFKNYLDTIQALKGIYDFKYKPHDEFIRAGRFSGEFKTVIVIIKDFFYEKTSNMKGLKLSNYSRFCWPTVNPLADKIKGYIEENGYKAEYISVPDRAAACKAGLGYIGKNSLFYAYGLGSFVGIKTIGTDFELDENSCSEERVNNAVCTSCNRCIKACPTGAINANGYVIDPRKCISFINRHVEEPAKVLPDHTSKAKGWLHGCDICQDCCPLNAGIQHKKNIVYQNEIYLYGIKVPNNALIDEGQILGKLDEINEVEYKKYIVSLLKIK